MPPTDLLLTALVNGVATGFLYALVAVGFSLIFGVGRIFFFAHGEIYMLGGLGALIGIERMGLPFFPVLFGAMLCIGLLGLIFEKFLIRRFHGKVFVITILTLAIAMLIRNLSLRFVGGLKYGVHTPFPGVIDIGGVTIARDSLAIIGIALAAILFLHFFLHRAKLGQAMRAVAQDPEVAALQGIDRNRTMQVVLFISLAIAGGAGVLIAPIHYVGVFSGTPALMNTFAVVILGGIGSFPGAIAGGLLLGILHGFGGIFIGGLTSLAAFVIIMIFLVVRPQGFFGRE